MTVSTSRLIVVALVWVCTVTLVAQRPTPQRLREHPSIDYWQTPPDDAVTALDRKLRQGALTLEFAPVNGYLESALAALGIPVSSQVLVFSKTSFQAPRINPQNPRAIYFNDRVAVGWVRGGEVLEFIAQDPRQGAMFYTMEQTPGGRPAIQRNAACVSCHTGEATRDVPGWFVASVFPGRDGTTQYGPAYSTDHRSPFMLRWGGWYVTGTHNAERHLGNAVVTGADLAAMVTPESLRVTSLAGRFDPTGYPTLTSDIVSLMVLEHQTTGLNLITRLAWEARAGEAAAGRPLAAAVEELVDYLVFVDEEPLPGPVAGTTTFAATFSAQGPRDGRGRSLREFDLRTRLMRYPSSYLVYSEAFVAMPPAAKRAVFARLAAVLTGAATEPRYTALDAEGRRAALEILRDTVPGFSDGAVVAGSAP